VDRLWEIDVVQPFGDLESRRESSLLGQTCIVKRFQNSVPEHAPSRGRWDVAGPALVAVDRRFVNDVTEPIRVVFLFGGVQTLDKHVLIVIQGVLGGIQPFCTGNFLRAHLGI
jgi:hypothetical protein